MSSAFQPKNESVILCVNYLEHGHMSIQSFNRLIGESNTYISQFCDTWKYPAITLKGILPKSLTPSLANLNKVIGIIAIVKDKESFVASDAVNSYKIPIINIPALLFKKGGFIKVFYNGGDHTISSIFIQKAISLIVNPRQLFTYVNNKGEVIRFDVTGPVDDELIISNEEKTDDKKFTFPSYTLPSWFGINQSPFTNMEKTTISAPYQYTKGSYKYLINTTTGEGKYIYNGTLAEAISGEKGMSELREKLISEGL